MAKENVRKDMVAKKLMQEMGRKNPMSIPKVEKVVVAVGVGKKHDKKWTEHVVDRVSKITGQRPVVRGAKKSIATFKVRTGDASGVVVTLRGDRMYGFLEKLISVAYPRTRDFRGLSKKCIDDMGNLTLGIKEHVVFPETADEELKDVFGLAVTIVSSAKNKKEAEILFTTLGIPFKKD